VGTEKLRKEEETKQRKNIDEIKKTRGYRGKRTKKGNHTFLK
jgi:hypothetical protein